MIAFQDFAPRQTSPGGLLKVPEYEPFEEAVLAANTWIGQSGVTVINVETIVLPNIWNPREQGTHDSAVYTSGDMFSTWHQFVRVWYEEA